jgi:type II secretory pathway pseudopilin PulG
MTLVEVLVAMGLFAVLGTLLLGFAISTSNVTDETRKITNIGEETRVAMERMTRELRQAVRIAAVQLPVAADDPTRFTLWADFDGNGCIEPEAVDPEQLTYAWDPTTDELTLTATVGATTHTEKLLAATVSTFSVDLSSSSWEYDVDQDGTTTWQELNSSPIGDGNPAMFTAAELSHIDLVRLSMAATDGSHEVHYSTHVDLRNRHQDGEMTTCP